jgi:tetratricopeptide (TPR) repeat protein
MKLDSGNMKEARAMFDKAIGAFKDVNDQINVTLIYCNIGHSQRAAAEALVAELDSWKGDVLYEQILRKVFDDAVLQYKAALNSYQTAKMELQVSEVSKKDIGLRDEVSAQCARTYLRLGMLLAKEDKYGFQAINKYRECLVADSLAQQHRRINISADSAIGQAMHLYEKLGSPLAQELAFTHFQLACYYRDCCFEMMKFEMRKLSDSAFQKPKRYLTLAESYWLKALKYYKPTSHPDMFLDILMEMSALNVAVSSSSGSPSVCSALHFFSL